MKFCAENFKANRKLNNKKDRDLSAFNVDLSYKVDFNMHANGNLKVDVKDFAKSNIIFLIVFQFSINTYHSSEICF